MNNMSMNEKCRKMQKFCGILYHMPNHDSIYKALKYKKKTIKKVKNL